MARSSVTRVAALAAVLSAGGCVNGVPRDDPTPSTVAAPLSVSLARFRTPSASADGSGEPLANAPTASDDAPGRAWPRALDPVPPLYVPPSRRPVLQPILDAPLAASSEPRSRPDRFVPPTVTDPLRRIDPVSGRDPLGRPDPSGGVDLDGTLAR